MDVPEGETLTLCLLLRSVVLAVLNVLARDVPNKNRDILYLLGFQPCLT